SALGGPAQETTAGLVADPAARVVHDPIERAGVPRVRDEPQIGEDVHDLAPLVEACAADDLVRHVSPPQRLLERARLRVRTVEDHEITGRTLRLAAEAGLDLRDDPFRLVRLVRGLDQGQRLARPRIGPEDLALPANV